MVAQNHVAVAVAVGSGAEIRRIVAVEDIHQFVRISQVGIGVPLAEILQRHGIHQTVFRCIEPIDQNLPRIRACDRVHGIELHAKTAIEQQPDRRKIEDRCHQFGIIDDTVDDFDQHASKLEGSNYVKRQVRRILDFVSADLLAVGENGISNLLRSRSAIAGVVFDAEIAIRPARIMAGGKDNAAEGLVFSDDAGGSRRRQDTTLSNQYATEAVGCSHLQDDLYRLPVVISTVAAQRQRGTGRCVYRIKNALDKIFQIMRLLKNADPLAQA